VIWFSYFHSPKAVSGYLHATTFYTSEEAPRALVETVLVILLRIWRGRGRF